MAYFSCQKIAYHQLKSSAVSPPRLQILGIDRKGMIENIISYGTWYVICSKNAGESADHHKFAMTQNAQKRCWVLVLAL